MNELFFDRGFEALTGHPPFPWQRRLFGQFRAGHIPSAVDIPTGLGKTAVMAVWLLARSVSAPLPRRLVYVVDRRAVVDQATDFALRLRQALEVNKSLGRVQQGLGLLERSLPISTLRGQHIDNREWLDDPTAPAIIVATVDMIGSRLLFEGYGVSRRMRSYHAGLLGCDTLVLLDEAHLSRPFEKLLQKIEFERRPAVGNDLESEPGMFAGPRTGQCLPPSFKVLPLSATLGFSPHSQAPFTIDHEDRTNETVRTRLEARKLLHVEELRSDSTLDAILALRAWDLARQEGDTAASPPRILIYCHSRKIAEGVRAHLARHEKEEKTGAEVVLFVGGRRAHERETAAIELRRHGLLGDSVGLPATPVFLVATSAGEVGVDLDADHMVSDLVAWERMVQRLGRVNRRGHKSARILVIDQGPPDDEAEREQHLAVKQLLDGLPQCDEGRLAGPEAIAEAGRTPEQRDLIVRASTPMPLYPELTRPLIDAWAMTSLREHTGRPEVEPWLRGWVRQDPQTTLVWRRFLPVRMGATGHDARVISLQDRAVERFFEAAQPHTAEQLQTETSRVVDWLRKRARKLLASVEQLQVHGPYAEVVNVDSPENRADGVVPLRPESPIAFVLGRGGEFESVLRLSDAATNLKARDLDRQLAGRLVAVDARICGLTDGLLDPGNGESVPTADDNWGNPAASSFGPGSNHAGMKAPPAVRVRLIGDGERERILHFGESDSQDGQRRGVEWREVWSAPYRTAGDDSVVTWLAVEKWRTAESDEDSRAMSMALQDLEAHQEQAAAEAGRIATDLGLPATDRVMLMAAARHHDQGKRAKRWQRAFNAPRTGGPYAKTPGPVNRHALNGYRHEFQSLIDVIDNGLDGLERSDPRFDLALHLIAAHHGHARPAIGIDSCDELPPSVAGRRALEIGQRFARLQRQWGPWGLAWWEALLRAADQRASRALDEMAVRKQATLAEASPASVRSVSR